MTLRGQLISLFPAVYLICVLSLLVLLFFVPHWISLLAIPLCVYLFPLTAFKIHNLLCPLKEEDYDLSRPSYNPWWGSYMLQYPFIAFPFLEGILHMIPGLFSLWLRMWGSQIGKNVLWTPRVEILDRSLLIIGDQVTFGHMTILCSHAITTIKDKPTLRLRCIRIGKKSFIGADSQLGPGTIITEKTMVPAKSRLYWKGKLKNEY